MAAGASSLIRAATCASSRDSRLTGWKLPRWSMRTGCPGESCRLSPPWVAKAFRKRSSRATGSPSVERPDDADVGPVDEPDPGISLELEEPARGIEVVQRPSAVGGQRFLDQSHELLTADQFHLQRRRAAGHDRGLDALRWPFRDHHRHLLAGQEEGAAVIERDWKEPL